MLRYVASGALTTPPPCFDGELQELYERFVEPNLPPVDEVAYQHQLLVDYCRQPEPLFIVRHVRGTERRVISTTSSGHRFKPSDNAPAWWMHFLAFNGIRDVDLSQMPTHMFDVARVLPTHISAAGWHVAHIFNARDGNTDWKNWSREGLTRRFIRNVHPCNYSFIPKSDWRRYGAHPGVIAFLASAHERRYGAVWKEFLKLAGGDPLGLVSPPRYVYSAATRSIRTSRVKRTPVAAEAIPGVAVSYKYGRICFKANEIEPLEMDDVFRVVTPAGTFQMTKGDFYRDFPKVVLTRSYQIGRIYNRDPPPAQAMKYRLATPTLMSS
jgi:hypothetical protein